MTARRSSLDAEGVRYRAGNARTRSPRNHRMSPTQEAGYSRRVATRMPQLLCEGQRHAMFRRFVIAITSWSTVAVASLAMLAGSPAGSKGATDPGSTGRVWSLVSAGYRHTCGIRSDHSLWCWGWNHDGQLGLGDRVSREPDPGRWPHPRLGIRPHRLELHLRDAARPHPVVLGREQWRPARTRRHHRPVHPRQGGQRHQLGTRRRRQFPHLRHPLRPHAVLLGMEPVRPARARRHHRQVHPDPGRPQYRLGPPGPRLRPHVRDAAWPHPVVLGMERVRPARPGRPGRPLRADGGRQRRRLDVPRPRRFHTCAARAKHTSWCWGSNRLGQLGLGDSRQRLVPTRV